MTIEIEPHDARLTAATGVLQKLNQAGELAPADIHISRTLCQAVGEESEEAAALAALTVRDLRHGSVCLNLDDIGSGQVIKEELGHVNWSNLIQASPLFTHPQAPMHKDGQRIYLQRYWAEETRVLNQFQHRLQASPTAVTPEIIDRYFPDQEEVPTEVQRQWRAAVQVATREPLSLITGWPGSGKTTVISRILGVLFALDEHASIALAAPTGKAAARMAEGLAQATARKGFPQEHVQRILDLTPLTIHRLLGYSQARGFTYTKENPLAADVIIIDETSMVSLPLMARILEAASEQARLIFVGDRNQLASVDVGTVLSDLIHGVQVASENGHGALVSMEMTNRFGPEVLAFAQDVNHGRETSVEQVLTASDNDMVRHLSGPQLLKELLPGAIRTYEQANAGNAHEALRLLKSQQLLCAHRAGPDGVAGWNKRIRTALEQHVGETFGRWYPGQPILITSNNYELELFNGDTGVVVNTSEGLMAVFERGGAPQFFSLGILGEVETSHAISVHRSQGSEYVNVYVALPDAVSRVLSRELLYTAITRTRECVLITGPIPVIKKAVQTPVKRASGLADRLRRGGESLG